MAIALTSISPNTLAAGSPPASVDVYGAGFSTDCVCQSDAVIRTTFFIDAGHVQFTARPDVVTVGAVHEVTVQNQAGDISNSLPFTITGPPAQPSIAFWECPCGINISSSQPLPTAPICVCLRTMTPVVGKVPQILFNAVKVDPQNQRQG